MAKRVSKVDMRQTELQRVLLSMSGRYTTYEIFMDWIECCALALANSCTLFHGEIWTDREEKYKLLMNKYTSEEQLKFAEMLAWFVEEIEDTPRDVLGEVFMKSGMGSDAGGQFFTPFNISLLSAELVVEAPEGDEIVTLNEPSCGSGGGVIAAALTLKEKGIDYQRRLKVVAQDLDWRCVYMCYMQLSYLGINAVCVQGDTLIDPYRKGYPEARILRTPMSMGVLL